MTEGPQQSRGRMTKALNWLSGKGLRLLRNSIRGLLTKASKILLVLKKTDKPTA